MKKLNSQTTEDYLKAVYTLEEDNQRVKTSLLAMHLSLTPGSVTDMLKRLSAMTPPLIDYRHHRGVRLTAAGRKIALNVVRRHRLLETFLHRILGFDWDEVHKEAEVLEHHLSERVTDAIERLLDYPETDPHGEAIPSKKGTFKARDQILLSDLDVGLTVRVVRVHPNTDEMLNYLKTIGISVGIRMVLEQRAPFNGPLTLNLERDGRKSRCILARELTDHIYVSTL